jgi:hypothetical protein
LLAEAAELPNARVTDCMLPGGIRSHWSPAGRFRSRELNVT